MGGLAFYFFYKTGPPLGTCPVTTVVSNKTWFQKMLKTSTVTANGSIVYMKLCNLPTGLTKAVYGPLLLRRCLRTALEPIPSTGTRGMLVCIRLLITPPPPTTPNAQATTPDNQPTTTGHVLQAIVQRKNRAKKEERWCRSFRAAHIPSRERGSCRHSLWHDSNNFILF